MQETRRARMTATIMEEMSVAIRGLKDPRIHPVTLTRIEVTPDAGMATIYVTLLGYNPDLPDHQRAMKETIHGLDSATGLLRHHLAKALTTRTTPEIKFREDRGLSNATRVEELLQELEKQRAVSAQNVDATETEKSDESDRA